MDYPPPPYIAGSLPINLRGHDTAPARNPLKQFRRYVIEIMTFTFDVDFPLLNNALGESEFPMNSTLTPSEHVKLLELSTLMGELKKKVSEGDSMAAYDGTQFLAVRSSDHEAREAVAEAVLRPALHLGPPGAYTLELLGTYSMHKCKPINRSLSCISQRKPYFYSFWRRLGHLGFETYLGSCTKVIENVVDNLEVRNILAEAMAVYLKVVLGITRVHHHPMEWGED